MDNDDKEDNDPYSWPRYIPWNENVSELPSYEEDRRDEPPPPYEEEEEEEESRVRRFVPSFRDNVSCREKQNRQNFFFCIDKRKDKNVATVYRLYSKREKELSSRFCHEE